MAAREGRDCEGLKAALRSGIQMIINRLNYANFNDEDGRDYLCSHIDRVSNLLARASALFYIPQELATLLQFFINFRIKLVSSTGEYSKHNASRCYQFKTCIYFRLVLPILWLRQGIISIFQALYLYSLQIQNRP